MKEMPLELSAAVNSLHGTETSPKEMVAVPIARGAMVANIRDREVGGQWSQRVMEVPRIAAYPGCGLLTAFASDVPGAAAFQFTTESTEWKTSERGIGRSMG